MKTGLFKPDWNTKLSASSFDSQLRGLVSLFAPNLERTALVSIIQAVTDDLIDDTARQLAHQAADHPDGS